MRLILEHSSTHFFDTSWLLRMDNAWMFVSYLDFFDTTNENFLLQQLFGRSSFVYFVCLSDVLSSCEVSLLLTIYNFVVQLYQFSYLIFIIHTTATSFSIKTTWQNHRPSVSSTGILTLTQLTRLDSWMKTVGKVPHSLLVTKMLAEFHQTHWEPISWKLIDSSAVLGLAHSDFVDFPTRLAHSLFQTVFHASEISFDGAAHAQFDCFNISCKSATFLLHRRLSIAAMWKYLDARVASIHRNRFRHRTETNNVYHRNSDARWLDAWASWEDFQVFRTSGEIKAQTKVEKSSTANVNDQEIEFHCRWTFSQSHGVDCRMWTCHFDCQWSCWRCAIHFDF